MFMKKAAIAAAILCGTASNSLAIDQSEYWKSSQMDEGMRNCTYSEALIGAGRIHQAKAFGMNVEAALGVYCSELMGFMWRCEANNQPVEFCAEIVRDYARDGIERAMTTDGY